MLNSRTASSSTQESSPEGGGRSKSAATDAAVQLLLRGFARLPGDVRHLDDVGRDLLRAGCGLLHIAGDFLGRHALLFDRGGDGRGDLVDVADGLGDAFDGMHRVLGRRLDSQTEYGSGFAGVR